MAYISPVISMLAFFCRARPPRFPRIFPDFFCFFPVFQVRGAKVGLTQTQTCLLCLLCLQSELKLRLKLKLAFSVFSVFNLNSNSDLNSNLSFPSFPSASWPLPQDRQSAAGGDVSYRITLMLSGIVFSFIPLCF